MLIRCVWSNERYMEGKSQPGHCNCCCIFSTSDEVCRIACLGAIRHCQHASAFCRPVHTDHVGPVVAATGGVETGSACKCS